MRARKIAERLGKRVVGAGYAAWSAWRWSSVRAVMRIRVWLWSLREIIERCRVMGGPRAGWGSRVERRRRGIHGDCSIHCPRGGEVGSKRTTVGSGVSFSLESRPSNQNQYGPDPDRAGSCWRVRSVAGRGLVCSDRSCNTTRLGCPARSEIWAGRERRPIWAGILSWVGG